MVFSSTFDSSYKILGSTRVIFVEDALAKEQTLEADPTTEALIASCPFEYVKLKSSQVTLETLKAGHHCHWIFCSFVGMNPNLIPTIVGNMKYSILECEYKYCRFLSPEKHQNISGSPCDCHNQLNGKIISAFFQGAQSLWWMSQAQKERYLTMFPFLSEKDNIVLSSVFDPKTLGTLKWLRSQVESSSNPRKGWIVLGSDSWVKGADAAKKWCEDNGKDYEVVWGVSYDEMLDKLAHAEGLVYLPQAAEACPRLVIEAKLLGCKLLTNENVQHRDEEWFSDEDLESVYDYLYAAPGLFWKGIREIMDYKPAVSGYTTTYNCVSQQYPFIQCIESMAKFCAEVCVVDGGSTDGTWQTLQRMSAQNPVIKVKHVIRDWSHPRHAVFDGAQKAEARSMCTGDFCWQMDSDEILPEEDGEKVIKLAQNFPKGVDVISLPVVDFWGKEGKVRIDVTPWKWRLSRNSESITHGIPIELRRFDSDGSLYSAPGSDGCCMISKESGQRIDHITFVSRESESVRFAALNGNKEALASYQNWFNTVVKNLPSVRHYSWYDIPRKIRTYKSYWSRHWESLYNVKQEDTAENNMFFNKPWSEVSDGEIEDLAEKLSSEIGGWVWHRKWDGTKTPHIVLENS